MVKKDATSGKIGMSRRDFCINAGLAAAFSGLAAGGLITACGKAVDSDLMPQVLKQLDTQHTIKVLYKTAIGAMVDNSPGRATETSPEEAYDLWETDILLEGDCNTFAGITSPTSFVRRNGEVVEIKRTKIGPERNFRIIGGGDNCQVHLESWKSLSGNKVFSSPQPFEVLVSQVDGNRISKSVKIAVEVK